MISDKDIDDYYWKENYKKLYERIDWFLKWLIGIEPNVTSYVYQEWLRCDPYCTGVWAREKMEELKCKR